MSGLDINRVRGLFATRAERPWDVPKDERYFGMSVPDCARMGSEAMAFYAGYKAAVADIEGVTK